MKSRKTPEVAIVVSCVGRKLVMNQRVEEEVEQVRDALESLWQGFTPMEK
jgi:hypothetical protein